jgi:hypothetical protein
MAEEVKPLLEGKSSIANTTKYKKEVGPHKRSSDHWGTSLKWIEDPQGAAVSSFQDVLPHHSPKAMGPTSHGLKSL